MHFRKVIISPVCTTRTTMEKHTVHCAKNEKKNIYILQYYLNALLDNLVRADDQPL